jgi:hypothetical protein
MVVVVVDMVATGGMWEMEDNERLGFFSFRDYRDRVAATLLLLLLPPPPPPLLLLAAAAAAAAAATDETPTKIR